MSKEIASKAADSKPKKIGFGKKFIRFFKDSKSEFKKIIWPTKKQVLNNTIVVIVFMAIAFVIIMALDWVFINLVGLMF
ncbi:MAG: preprotein translocase subunit SecE [Oscillospiraceae bacterium]